jgi:hypothetical protein
MFYREIISQGINFLIYFFLQVIFLHHVSMFNYAFCFVYVAFLLFLPFQTDSIVLLLLAFAMGFLTDLSYSIMGIHSAASVFLAFVRNFAIKRIEPISGYDASARPSVHIMGLQWFSQYSFPLIFLHHGILFFVEVNNSELFMPTLFKVLASSLFTFVMILLIQYIFYRPQGGGV